MSDEKVITLTEFKVVMEGVDSKLKKIVEVMDYRFGKIDERFTKIDERFESLEKKMDTQFREVNGNIHSLQQQVGLLHEGQTAIRSELRAGLKDKVT